MTDSTAPPAGPTAADLLASGSGDGPTRPLLTWYDDATGERVELSGRTFGNWVAKTANLLVDGCGLGPGDTAAVNLPPHWQTAAVLVGCWTAGLTVDMAAPAAADMAAADMAFAADVAATDVAAADVAFAASASSAPSAADRFLLGLAPMGMPMPGGAPAGWLDFVAEARGQGDRFTPVQPVRPTDPAWGDETHAELLTRAAARAAELGIPPDARVLIDVDEHPDPVDWLVAPLVMRTSVVLCANLDEVRLASRLTAERAARV